MNAVSDMAALIKATTDDDVAYVKGFVLREWHDELESLRAWKDAYRDERDALRADKAELLAALNEIAQNDRPVNVVKIARAAIDKVSK